jgi:hypothetical protein
MLREPEVSPSNRSGARSVVSSHKMSTPLPFPKLDGNTWPLSQHGWSSSSYSSTSCTPRLQAEHWRNLPSVSPIPHSGLMEIRIMNCNSVRGQGIRRPGYHCCREEDSPRGYDSDGRDLRNEARCPGTRGCKVHIKYTAICETSAKNQILTKPY